MSVLVFILDGMRETPAPDYGRPHTSQDILNESWPANPRRVAHSVLQYRVIARVVWQVDGIEHLMGYAIAWHGRHVLVELNIGHRRAGTTRLWLDVDDIHRLAEPPRYAHHIALTDRCNVRTL